MVTGSDWWSRSASRWAVAKVRRGAIQRLQHTANRQAVAAVGCDLDDAEAPARSHPFGWAAIHEDGAIEVARKRLPARLRDDHAHPPGSCGDDPAATIVGR